MTTDQPTAICPTCGSTLFVQGETTQSFVPVDVRQNEQDRYIVNVGAYVQATSGHIARLTAELQAATRVIHALRNHTYAPDIVIHVMRDAARVDRIRSNAPDNNRLSEMADELQTALDAYDAHVAPAAEPEV